VVAREVVMQAADWFVTDFQVLREALPRHRVAMIGSGGGRMVVVAGQRWLCQWRWWLVAI
jgi:hypothetical protein